MKRILCFGDSNTWGYNPGSAGIPRFAEGVRWTSLLQEKLGADCKVIEFGLCGCEASGKNKSMCFNADGRTLYPPVLFASLPVDVVIIMLGTNDLKKVNEWKKGDTASGVKKMVRATQELSPKTQIVLCPAVLLDERVTSDAEFSASAVADSKDCAAEIAELARAEGLLLFDTNAYVHELREDGCHFTAASHASFAESLAAFLREQVL